MQHSAVDVKVIVRSEEDMTEFVGKGEPAADGRMALVDSDYPLSPPAEVEA